MPREIHSSYVSFGIASEVFNLGNLENRVTREVDSIITAYILGSPLRCFSLGVDFSF